MNDSKIADLDGSGCFFEGGVSAFLDDVVSPRIVTTEARFRLFSRTPNVAADAGGW